MEVTEVRIKLMNDPHERLLAFCSITLDNCFVVRDLKIIQGTRGAFVAMPSRKLTDHCGRCHGKNHLRARFCSECGAQLNENRADTADDSRAKLYADIAHPINSNCRETIQSGILESYEEELLRAARPDYVCTYDDYGEDRVAEVAADTAKTTTSEPVPQNGNGAVPRPETRRRFETSDDRSHRIDPSENPRVPTPHERVPQPHRAHSRVGEDGFAEGIV